jgi:hypothetical protein
MEFQAFNPGGDGSPHGTGPAAKVHNNGGLRTILDLPHRLHREQCYGLIHHEPGAPTRDKNSGIELNPEPAEFCPAEDVLQRIPGNAPLHCRSDAVRAGCGEEQAGFLFRKDAPGRAKPLSDPHKGLNMKFRG